MGSICADVDTLQGRAPRYLTSDSNETYRKPFGKFSAPASGFMEPVDSRSSIGSVFYNNTEARCFTICQNSGIAE
jgi:hypothetical protein